MDTNYLFPRIKPFKSDAFRQCGKGGFLLLKKIDYKKAAPLIAIFLMWLLVFSFARPDFGDDSVRREAVLSEGAFSVWQTLQRGWSSRFIIEAIQMPFFLLSTSMFHWAFRIVNSAAFTLMSYALYQVSAWGRTKTVRYAALLSTFLFPISIFASAGWFVTSAVCLWPLSLGMYALVPVVKRLQGRTVEKHYAVTATLSIIIAANHEQIGAMLVGFLGCIILYFLWKKESPGALVFVFFVISALLLCYSLLAESNALRETAEIRNSYPIFYAQSTLERLFNGFLATALYLLSPETILIQVMCIVLAAVVAQKYSDPLIRIVGSIPALYFFLFGTLRDWTLTLFPALQQFYVGTIDQMSLYNPDVLVSCAVTLFVYLLIGVILIFTMPTRPAGCLMAITWAGGLATRLVIGLSPTLYASTSRTFFITLACILAILCVLIGEYERNCGSRTPLYLFILMSVGMWLYQFYIV